MQFYKFSSISQRSIVSLITGKFWASSLSNMNDPFEDRFEDKMSQKIVANCGVFCLSGIEPGRQNILTNPLMWAHYSINHSGIAIGLEYKSEGSPPFKIEYLNDEEIEKKINSLLKDYNGKTGIEISPWAEIFFKYKPNFWEYENEYRQVHLASSNTYIDPRLYINEVVFGLRTKPEDELAIWSALRESIRYKKAFNKNGKIQIESYHPPTRIETTNRYILSMNNSGVDLDKMPEEKNILSAKHEFKSDI